MTDRGTDESERPRLVTWRGVAFHLTPAEYAALRTLAHDDPVAADALARDYVRST